MWLVVLAPPLLAAVVPLPWNMLFLLPLILAFALPQYRAMVKSYITILKRNRRGSLAETAD
jgi:hypothetical protein